jgi:hypothetical protein
MAYHILSELLEGSRYNDLLWDGRQRGGGSSPDKGKNFLHVFETDSGAYPFSYLMSTEGSFPRGKAAGALSWPLTSN